MESLDKFKEEVNDILVKTKDYQPQFDHLRKHEEANSGQSTSNKAEGHNYPPITMAELDEKLKITDLNFKHNDDILRAIDGVIEQIERKLCTTTNYEYNGKCYPVGSSRDGTRPGNLEEFDYVYMNQVEGLKLYGDENDKYTYKAYTTDEYSETEIDAKNLNEMFQDCIDDLFKEHLELPENLSHAGFASPYFSGVRRMGPAATILFFGENHTEISIDLTTVLPVPSKKADEIREEIREKLKHIQSENAETYYDVNNLMHFVGKTPGQRSWELSTTHLECEIIKQLHETAPAKKAIKYGMIVYEDHMKDGIAIAQDTCNIEHDKGGTGETIITLLGIYQSGEVKGKDLKELREDIMKIMRYAHIFIPPEGDSAFHGRFHELTKSPVGIRSYAMRHLIFTEASKKIHSGSFRPTNDDRKAARLLSAVFHQLHIGNKVDVQHYFFKGKQVPFLSWAEHTPNERDRMAKEVKDHCGVITKKIQKKKTSKPNGQRKGLEEPFAEQLEIKLHKYQEELVNSVMLSPDVVVNQNVIFLAPRGSGKFITAVAVAKIHLKHLVDEHPKVLITANTNNKLWQRWEQCKQFLGEYTSVGVSNEYNSNKDSLQNMIDEADILLVTPEFFYDAILAGDIKEHGFGNFTLMIIDGCHLVKGKCKSNQLMTIYIDEKFKQVSEEKSFKLPQVIGLTSFPVTSKKLNSVKVKNQIITMCANIDARGISTVEKNVQDMSNYILGENEVNMTPLERIDSQFSQTLNSIMNAVEKEMESMSGMFNEVAKHWNKKPECKAIDYHIWIQSIANTALHHLADDTMIRLRTAAKHLLIYRDALEIWDWSLARFALDHIENTFRVLHEKKVETEYELHLLQLYEERLDILRQTAEDEYNPRLSQLEAIIHNNVRQNKSVHVSCRTKLLASALEKWMKDDTHGLAMYKPTCMYGKHSHTEDEVGMTNTQQALAEFRKGDCKLLVSAYKWVHIIDSPLDVCDCVIVLAGNKIQIFQKQAGSVMPSAEDRMLGDAISEIRHMSTVQFRELIEATQYQAHIKFISDL